MEKKKKKLDKVIYVMNIYTYFFSLYFILMMVLFGLHIESLVLNYLLVLFSGIYAGNYLGQKNYKIKLYNSRKKSD